jgi:hypothetical protein
MRKGNMGSGKRTFAHWGTRENSLMNEPGAKSPHGARRGFDGARRARSTHGGWRLTQGGNPVADIRFGDLAHLKEMAFNQQVVLKLAQCSLMPFERFRTMPGLAVGLQIGLDRSFDGQTVTSPPRCGGATLLFGWSGSNVRGLNKLAWLARR